MSCEQPAFVIHIGDLLPLLEVYVRTCCGQALVFLSPTTEGTVFDFTGWTALTFSMSGPSDMSGAATADLTTGKLTFTWVAGNTAVPGFYEGRFKGTSPAGKQQTFPTKGAILIEVAE